MGRLFWKFFFAILFAQLVTTIGVGATFWVWDQARDKPSAGTALIDTSASASAILDAAALTLKYGGVNGLRELAGNVTGKSIFILDDSGKDVLGRIVSADMRAEAQRLYAGSERGDAVRRLTSAEGQQVTVFLRRADGPAREFRGPPPDLFRGAGRAGPHRRPPDGGIRIPYISMAVGTLASLLFAALLAWYFSRPIRALRDAFEAASMGDLAPRFGAAKPGRGDELVDLGHDFDRMSAQLRALMDNQRRLLHDVSHELRSPLARLQAAIGLAHQQPDKVAVSLERIERESARMDKLVGELLALARLESSSGLPAAEEIAIMELVAEIAADAQFEAASQGRHVVMTGSTPAQVRGTPDLLWRAIENVVRNAIKHSPVGAAVEIALEALPARVLVHVLDRGTGVDPLDLETIFHPFFRSHPLANNLDGHGLGLAIAQRVVAAHGGTIVAANRDGGGLRVTIALPDSASFAGGSLILR
jgi:two-component system OmpR family sensor kinase